MVARGASKDFLQRDLVTIFGKISPDGWVGEDFDLRRPAARQATNELLAVMLHVTIAQAHGAQSGASKELDRSRDVLAGADRQDRAACEKVNITAPKDFDGKESGERILDADGGTF